MVAITLDRELLNPVLFDIFAKEVPDTLYTLLYIGENKKVIIKP